MAVVEKRVALIGTQQQKMQAAHAFMTQEVDEIRESSSEDSRSLSCSKNSRPPSNMIILEVDQCDARGTGSVRSHLSVRSVSQNVIQTSNEKQNRRLTMNKS